MFSFYDRKSQVQCGTRPVESAYIENDKFMFENQVSVECSLIARIYSVNLARLNRREDDQ